MWRRQVTSWQFSEIQPQKQQPSRVHYAQIRANPNLCSADIDRVDWQSTSSKCESAQRVSSRGLPEEPPCGVRTCLSGSHPFRTLLLLFEGVCSLRHRIACPVPGLDEESNKHMNLLHFPLSLCLSPQWLPVNDLFTVLPTFGECVFILADAVALAWRASSSQHLCWCSASTGRRQ